MRSVWDAFDPDLMTLCSPDPQAFRPPDEKVNVLQVSLPTNFKAARFASDAHTAILRQLEADIDATRFETAHGPVELPVKLKVHESVFVPLAKWSMLMTGNYRCVQRDDVRSIRDAVHSDLDASRAVYAWVGEVCQALGAAAADLVPFEKYANAALGLAKPSSAARALAAGAANIERVDRLVQTAGAQKGMRLRRCRPHRRARRRVARAQSESRSQDSAGRRDHLTRPLSCRFITRSRSCPDCFPMSIPTACSNTPSSSPTAR